MSQVEPLPVTLELPATEFIDHDGGLLVRCPINRAWVPLSDYYSEKEGQLLPLVGKVDLEFTPEEWYDTGEVLKSRNNEGEVIKEEPIMAKRALEPIVWKETVRVLEPVAPVMAEGGTLELNVAEHIATSEKFG